MSDQSAKFTNDIRIIGDSVTVQFFSLFYHHFLSANNSYIRKYHELMRTLKRSGDRIDEDSLIALFSVTGSIQLTDIRNFLFAAFTEIPQMMLAEEELLPLEEEFFRQRYPQFRSLLLRENFPAENVRLFLDQLISFSRLTEPTLAEMEKACRETEVLLGRRNTAEAAGIYLTDGTVSVAAGSGFLSGFRRRFGAVSAGPTGKNSADGINSQLFDVMFRYCVCWQNLIDVLKNHARELYGIYHGFFTQGLFDKYSRFYGDVAALTPQTADLFFSEFLKMEIMAYDNEFDRKADPENPEDDQTLRDVCRRVEEFFSSENGSKFY